MPSETCLQCGRPIPSDRASNICLECLSVGEQTLITQGGVSSVAQDELDDRQQNGEASVADNSIQSVTGGSDSSQETRLVGSSSVAAAGERGKPVARQFGDYEILDEIARGGMGVVFKARQTSLNRPVALKMILASQLASTEEVERFHIEAEAAANLDHPGIVPVYEVGEHDGQHFFSMGLVEGGSLVDLYQAGETTPRRAAELLERIAAAVQYAHARNIVHRDLKPANILIDSDGQPKITEFGLARNLESDSALTASGQVMGTPGYMPPEQAAGRLHEVGPLADVYSLGAILYFMLTGRPPFQGANVLETLSQVLHQEPTSPRSSNTQIDPDLETICLKCLQKEPGRRYASAAELAEELGRFLDDRSITARPISRTERAVKWVRRNRGLSAGLAAALLALIGGGIGVGVGISESEKQRIAVELRTVAETERDQAKAARAGEHAARLEAEQTRDQLARIEYGRSIQIAHQRWRDGNVRAVLALLEATPSPLRGWEWQYVNQLCHSEHLTLRSDSAGFLSVAFSPDGDRMVTGGGGDSLVRIWRTDTGEELLQLAGHTGPVNSVRYDSKGDRILTSSHDGTFRIWDAETGQSQKVFDSGSKQRVFARSWSPDDTRVVASLKGPEGAVRVWDAVSGQPLLELEQDFQHVNMALFSPDGSTIATSSGNGDETARIWNATTGKPIGDPLDHESYVASVSFSRDGSRLATAGVGNTRIWDLASGERLLELKGHSGPVECVKHSPEGDRIATASWDHTARIWNAKTGAEVSRLVGHTDRIGSVAFSPTGAMIATTSRDRTLKLWDALHNPEYLLMPVEAQEASATIRCVTFSPDSDQVAAVLIDKERGSRIRVWNVASGLSDSERTINPKKPAKTVSFSPDGKQLLASCDDGIARLLDLTSDVVTEFPCQAAVLWSAAFSRDGTRIVAACESSDTVRVWDPSSGQELLTITGARHFTGADLSPDNSRIVTAERSDQGDDCSARVWDARTGREIMALAGHRGPIWQARFNHDGSRIVTAGGDATARVWDAQTGTEQCVLRGHSRRLQSGVFSPDGTRIVTTSYDGTVKVWDADSGAELLTLKGHEGYIRSATFSPDGSQIVSGGDDGTVRVWGVRNSAKTDEETRRAQNAVDDEGQALPVGD